MKTFSIDVDIDAPPDTVWAVMSDVERWHEWTASITSVTRLDQGSLVVGSRAHVRQPRLRPADFVVTELVPSREFTWVTRSPGIGATARHAVAPIASGTRATLSVRFEGMLAGLVAFVYRTLTNDYLALEAAGLKKRSEEWARADRSPRVARLAN
ncbi:MAG TPA: SRPBCC family protein [Vicinamibacterales bacterium]|nr:SRPBCC family protein [Vicinamibacterales bacterium]